MPKKMPILLLLLGFLIGCESQVLFSDLNETEANEIVAVLYSNKLAAEKVADGKSDSYRVMTDKSSFSDAVSVLQSRGLPRERFESVGDVFQKDGFVSSPLEERARLNYATSQELSRTLSNIDGVIMARVHLAVPKKEHLAETVEPSSASVFVKHRSDVDLAQSVGKIKSLVVTGLENVPYENVTVGLFPAEFKTVDIDRSDVTLIKKASMGEFTKTTYIIILIVLFVVIANFITFTFLRSGNLAAKNKAEKK